MSFFNPTIIKRCADGINQRYLSNSKNESPYIRDLLAVYELSNQWGNRVIDQTSGFGIQHDSVWQISGSFKKYTWVRLFPRGFARFRIYYTVGIDFRGKSLVYKIDCQRRGKTKLLSDQIKRFDRFMAEKSLENDFNWKWQQVPFNDIQTTYPKGWDDLIPQTIRFIENSLDIYHQVVQEVWGLQQPAPTERRISLEDLLKKQERDRAQGKAAEEFVLRYERNRLHGSSRLHQIELLSDNFANAGYDIKSFHRIQDKQRNRLIEVKSFQGESHFYWSENEMTVADDKRSDYFIYLVDYNKMNEPGYIPVIIENPFETVFGNKIEWTQRAKSIYFEKKQKV